MSKTYRRKNETWDFEAYDYSWENGYFQKVPLNPKTKEYKKQKAHYHSDSYTGWCVPHWFVNLFFERSSRRKTKKEIKKWMKNPENHELIIDKHMKNAGWTYW